MQTSFNPPLSLDELSNLFTHISNLEISNSGGEATILKGFDETISRIVAIKIYNANHLITRSELEVNKLLKIDNPYLIKLYNYGKIIIRNTQCFFTETNWLDGNDLKTLLDEKGIFTEKEVIKIILNIASAIESLWREHVIHCDIKPANIMLNNTEYCLIDLGMAKHLDANTLTCADTIMGTWGYLAPEQFRGRKNLTFKADYYALGITAFELLTGFHPFYGDQHEMILHPDNISFPTDIPVSYNMQQLILKLLNPLPFNRPMNLNEIKNILNL